LGRKDGERMVGGQADSKQPSRKKNKQIDKKQKKSILYKNLRTSRTLALRCICKKKEGGRAERR